jgi:AbrB family looped-hinge helix DNA binding protein
MAAATTEEFVTVGEKGQIVIPKEFLKKLKLGPNSKLKLSVKDRSITLQAAPLSDVQKEWERIFKKMDRKGKSITPEQASDLIHEYRKKWREQRT